MMAMDDKTKVMNTLLLHYRSAEFLPSYIATATGISYQEVWDILAEMCKAGQIIRLDNRIKGDKLGAYKLVALDVVKIPDHKVTEEIKTTFSNKDPVDAATAKSTQAPK